MPVLIPLLLLAVVFVVAVTIGRFLARCEAMAAPPPATRHPQRDSLYARLLRASIEGPRDRE